MEKTAGTSKVAAHAGQLSVDSLNLLLCPSSREVVPDVIDGLCTPAVMVQEFSHGCRIDDRRWQQDGPRIAQALIDLYLHQFFVMGLFHGDPHPGNLFVLPDGRLCFHDFGVVGHLTPVTRRCLATHALTAPSSGV